MVNAKLLPDGLDWLIANAGQVLRRPEDVHYVNRFGHIGQQRVGFDAFPPADGRIDGVYGVAGALEIFADAIAGAVSFERQ